MSTKADEQDPLQNIRMLEMPDARYQGEVGPRVHAFGSHRPMGRIRAYTSAGLGPFAGRGVQKEFHLLGHVHLDERGMATRVEGFNGQEGQRWAEQAKEKLAAKGLLVEGAVVQPMTPLKGCPHTGIR